MKLKAPFPWFGGKSRAASMIWRRFGRVKSYVEPFAGSLAVLLGRPVVQGLETVNDLDGFVVNFWRAVKAAPELRRADRRILGLGPVVLDRRLPDRGGRRS